MQAPSLKMSLSSAGIIHLRFSWLVLGRGPGEWVDGLVWGPALCPGGRTASVVIPDGGRVILTNPMGSAGQPLSPIPLATLHLHSLSPPFHPAPHLPGPECDFLLVVVSLGAVRSYLFSLDLARCLGSWVETGVRRCTPVGACEIVPVAFEWQPKCQCTPVEALGMLW